MEMNSNKEHEILELFDFLYEEAFLLDREVMGEASEYMKFLDYAYDEKANPEHMLCFRNSMKEYIRSIILNCDSLNVKMLYDNFDSFSPSKEGDNIISIRKVV